MTKQDDVYAFVSRIPLGKVLSYGDVAHWTHIKNPRLVGYYLHKNPDPSTIPCHRVVSSTGGLSVAYAFGGISVQEKKLRNEGVLFYKNHVDMKQSRWMIK